MRRITLALCSIPLLASSAFAQQAPAAQATTAPPSAQGTLPRATTTTPPPPATAPAMTPPSGQQAPRPGVPAGPPYEQSSWNNVKIDVTISDSLTSTIQQRKTVSLLTLDNRSGQIRSAGGSSGLINVDARPSIQRDGRIVLQLTVEYQPELSPEQLQQANVMRGTSLTESLYVVLVEGKPTLLSQSSDPRSDRKVSLEVTATIVK